MTATAFVDTNVHPTAATFYQRCPDEAIGGSATMHVNNVVSIPDMTLESLLQQMVQLTSGDQALIVRHGTPQGLAMLLVPGAQPLVPARGRTPAQYVYATAEAMGVLNAVVSTDFPMSEADAASRLNITAAQVGSLRSLITQVRALRLAHVALRACNIGQSTANMGIIMAFFGASSLSAPDLPDSYGRLSVGTPNADATFWQRWLREHRGAHVYTVGSGRFALASSRSGLSASMAVLAESESIAEQWVVSHLPAGAWMGAGQPFLWHALFSSPPIFSGEPDYRAHIITV